MSDIVQLRGHMVNKFVNIGFNNTVNSTRVLAVLNPDTLPSKRLISDARSSQKLIDASCGRKTRSVILIDSGHVVLSGISSDTIMLRLNSSTDLYNDEDEDEK